MHGQSLLIGLLLRGRRLGESRISWKFFFLVSFSFLLGVDLCTIDSILPAGALVLVVWWGVGCLCGFLGYFSFDLAFVLVFVLFVCFVFVVSFSTINKVVAGEKL